MSSAPVISIAILAAIFPLASAASGPVEGFCTSPEFVGAFLDGQLGIIVDYTYPTQRLIAMGDEALPCLMSIAEKGGTGFGIEGCYDEPFGCERWAVWAIGMVGTPTAVRFLVDYLMHGTEQRSLATTMSVLSHLGVTEQRPALLKLLQHEDLQTRAGAVVALGVIGDQSDLKVMLKATLRLPDEHVYTASHGLYLLGDARAIKPLERRSRHIASDITRHALEKRLEDFRYKVDYAEGNAARKRGDQLEAERRLKSAVARADNSGYSKLVRASHDLAELYREQGRYEEAEGLVKRAIGSWHRTDVNPDWPAYVQILFSESLLRNARFKDTETAHLFVRALSLWERLPEDQRPDLAVYPGLARALAQNAAILREKKHREAELLESAAQELRRSSDQDLQGLDSRVFETMRSMRLTATLLEAYELRFGEYPVADGELRLLRAVFKVRKHLRAVDAWGTPLYYRATSRSYQLISFGADRESEQDYGTQAIYPGDLAEIVNATAQADDLVLTDGRFVKRPFGAQAAAYLTMNAMTQIFRAAGSFAVDNNQFPGNTSGFAPVAELIPELVPVYAAEVDELDGWGRPILYFSDGAGFLLVSHGADGEADRMYELDLSCGLHWFDRGASTADGGDVVQANGRFVLWPQGSEP